MGLTRQLGKVLYTQYLYAFEIAAAILIVAIVSAIALTLRKRKDVKSYGAAEAIKVRRSDRIRLVDMKAESSRAADRQVLGQADSAQRAIEE